MNKNILPPFVIASLYKQPVIPQAPGPDTATAIPAKVPAAPTVATVPEEPAGYKLLGKNLQRVAIIVDAPGEPFLDEDSLQLLTKMLGACKLNLGDVAIVNNAAVKVDMNKLNGQLHPVKTLLFGVEPASTGLPLSFPPFKEQEYAGCTYVFAPSLAELNEPTEEGKVLKGKLWACLKNLFNV